MTEARFGFGRNWQSYSTLIDEQRILAARVDITKFLGVETLSGKTFLDIGSGSGLHSLAARELGATVYSFDYDLDSVACTNSVKDRFRPDDADWTIERGDVLDEGFMRKLGKFDIVYSWGVLHHTGDVWQALENSSGRVSPGGLIFVALYNHKKHWTAFYTVMKRSYVRSPLPGKILIAGAWILAKIFKGLLRDLFSLKNPLARYQYKGSLRGMSAWHDWIDWIGGYPFEAVRPDDLFHFFRDRGYNMENFAGRGLGGHGCNDYLFRLVGDIERVPGNTADKDIR